MKKNNEPEKILTGEIRLNDKLWLSWAAQVKHHQKKFGFPIAKKGQVFI